MCKTINIFFILMILTAMEVQAQIKFQKQYAQPIAGSGLQTFDAKATLDGGYVLTGLASEGANNNLYHPFVIKLNCKGQIAWQHFFGSTQSTGNVYGKVIETADSGYVMINNTGVFNNYNGLAVRLSQSGNILWQKQLNLSNGNDNINDIQETPQGDLILSGSVKSTPDVALIKLSSSGNLLWCKTFGNNGQYDDGTALTVTDDGGYLVTGRYISMGTFNAFLLKTDSSGTLQWLKCYGDTNQHMWGFDVKQLANGDLVMTGSTTLLKPNFQSYGDNFLMRLTAQGDTLWTKIFYGNPDLFENGSTILTDPQDNIIVSVATASYPTPGMVPNKHAIMKFSSAGNLLSARTYNNGSSHYPRLSKAPDGGYILSGFGNQYADPSGFQSLLLKLDAQLQSGCFETDVTALTSLVSAPFKITQPTPVLGSSGSVAANAATYSCIVNDSTLCEFYPVLTAGIDTAGICAGQPVLFTADTAGITSWWWNFGDPATSGDTALIHNPVYNYPAAGTYTVTLRVSNGCDTVMNTIILNIKNCYPEAVTSLPAAYSELLVYPNPATTQLILESDWLKNNEQEIMLFDVFGQCVLKKRSNSSNGKIWIDIAHLPPGTYHLKAGEFVRKVIKK
ncbi:MAG: T9SS type A sorting domain-containing protein [Chitinophagaceae bacterium]|nr:T9SS type A sorting domain-containing protein [Chitinophagaceae bacterium]